MKILTAFVTVLTLLGFCGAAFACDGYMRTKQETATNTDDPVLPWGKTS